MGQRVSEFARVDGDLYETPAWVVDCLAEHVILEQRLVWEPAAGTGKMARALKAAGAYVRATDIEDHGSADDAEFGRLFKGVYDFTTPEPCPWVTAWDMIITNPPYGPRGTLAAEFIAIGLRRIVRGGTLALLLPVDFDSAKTRAHVFGEHPAFAAKLILRRRISWFEPPAGASGPSVNHAWFIWTTPVLRRPTPPVTLYAPTALAAQGADILDKLNTERAA